MKMQIFGIQKIQFTDNSGKEVKGTNIFCGFPEENTEGYRTEKFFLREGIALPKDTKINDTIDISFNMKGKVESIIKA